MFKRLLIKFGLFYTTLFSVGISTIISLIITLAAMSLLEMQNIGFGISIAIICPLFIATPAAYFLLRLVQNEIKRQSIEDALRYETEFRRVLGVISNEFITATSEEIDKSIGRALESICRFVGADRSYVIIFNFQEGTITNTHEWCTEGIEPQIDNLQKVPIEIFSWVIDPLTNLEVVHIPRVKDLPVEANSAKEEFEAEGIRSLLLVPLVSKGECVGTVGFDFVAEERFSIKSEANLLQMAGASLSNVLDRKQAEEALRASHERFLTVLDSIDATIYVADMESYEILFMNKNMVEAFKNDLTGQLCWDAFRGEQGPCQHCTNDQLIDENGRPSGACVWQGKNPITDRWYINHDRAIEWTGGRLVRLQIATDITDFKKLEQQLQQTQKIEAIGTLAGGIAHDFNNLLMGIQGRVSLMETDRDTYQAQREHIVAIEEYVKSATNLTKQLLGFARAGKYEVKPVDVIDLLKSTAAMFGRTRKEINIHAKTHTYPLIAEVDSKQIEQVFLNIFVNAWQAMPEGGDLFLETSVIDLDEEFASLNQIEPSRYCKISVTDTGFGMDEETQQRIFDPFFTTKDKERGTGLGLASAYGIIKNHGGMINVNSTLGHGTTFEIYLPKSEKEIPKETVPKKKMFHGSERVLLVDDEKLILDVGQAMLEKLGYSVIVAENGEKALKVVSEVGNKLDLIILDMIMPGMDGGKVFDRIRIIQPKVSVLLSSGYSINGQATEIMNRGCNGFIQKPFNLEKLSQKVRKILDAQSGSN